jgi:hypothetical protein
MTAGAYVGGHLWYVMRFVTDESYSYYVQIKAEGTIGGALCALGIELLLRQVTGRPVRFSLRTLLIATTLVALTLDRLCWDDHQTTSSGIHRNRGLRVNCEGYSGKQLRRIGVEFGLSRGFQIAQ